jgi:hypothetical protein
MECSSSSSSQRWRQRPGTRASNGVSSSSYMEGRCCPLAKRGYSRDGKRGSLQIIYGLICAPDGCPIAIEVFDGVAAPNVPTIETGTATAGISVAQTLRRYRKITPTTRQIVRIRVLCTSATEARIVAASFAGSSGCEWPGAARRRQCLLQLRPLSAAPARARSGSTLKGPRNHDGRKRPTRTWICGIIDIRSRPSSYLAQEQKIHLHCDDASGDQM